MSLGRKVDTKEKNVTDILSLVEEEGAEDEKEKGVGAVIFREMQFCFTQKTKTFPISDIGKTSPVHLKQNKNLC